MAEGKAPGQAFKLHELPKDAIELHELMNRRTTQVWRATYTGLLGQKRQVAAKKVLGVKSDNQAELLVLHQINHKHIIKFYGIWRQSDQNIYIIMELAKKGNLRNFLDECKANKQRLTSELIWKWTYEAASALHYLESIKHSHRNIMSQHFLIMDDYTLKLGEFGIAIRLEATQLTAMRGACKWMAPEVIREQLRSPKSDIFSYAIVIWEILTLGIPFDECGNNFQVMNAVCEGKRPEIPDDCPELLKSLMSRCWEGDRHRRPSTKDVCLELEPYQCTVSNFVEPTDGAAGAAADITDGAASTYGFSSLLSLRLDTGKSTDQSEPSGSTPVLPESPVSPEVGTSLVECALSDKFLMKSLAKHMGPEWEELAIDLDFTDGEVTHIKLENKDSIKQAIFKMLVKWRQRQNPDTGLQPILDTLSDALTSCEREDLAHKVRSLGKPVTPK